MPLKGWLGRGWKLSANEPRLLIDGGGRPRISDQAALMWKRLIRLRSIAVCKYRAFAHRPNTLQY